MKKTVTLLMMVFSLSACELGNVTGYVPTPAEIERIQVGKDTKETILQQYGRPSIVGEDQRTWYYVSQFRTARGPMPLSEVDRRGLAVTFNAKDVVSGIERFGLEDAKQIAVSKDVTESGGEKPSFWGQIIGAVGNYTPGSLLGE